MFQLKECIFLTKAHEISTFWTFHCLSEVVQIPETPIQSVQRSLNLLFQRTIFLIFPHFQKYLNPQFRTKKLVNSVFYHPCSSRLASQGYTFLYSFKLLRVLHLHNACWIFSDLYIPTCMVKIFQFMVFTVLENHWIYAFLFMPQSPIHNSC